MASQPDPWARWITETRFGGDQKTADEQLAGLVKLRDYLLEKSSLSEGKGLLDVGTGDGFVAFGALPRLGKSGQAIFSDISESLLVRAREIATQNGVVDQCRFVVAPAEHLEPIEGDSVDVVTTRSVLTYVSDKAQAFRELYRVLKKGGNTALFEPISPLKLGDLPGVWTGVGMTYYRESEIEPIRDLAARIAEVCMAGQPAEDTMVNFDERDLLRLSGEAGFGPTSMELHVSVAPPAPVEWDVFSRMPPNPLAPSPAELIERVLSKEEARRFVTHMRPLIEHGSGMARLAGVFLWARK